MNEDPTMKVLYKGVEYFIISDEPFWEILEIAPTRHGAGSFDVSRDYIQYVSTQKTERSELHSISTHR
jgi:hypothetical protein